jgi:hypothetical protein
MLIISHIFVYHIMIYKYMRKLKLLPKKDYILNLFDLGFTVAHIANILGEYQQSVSNLIKYYRNIESFLPNKGNSQYFNTIDTNAKAYIVGFIAADGALVKIKNTDTSNFALTITIKDTDIAILEFIKSEIGNSHNIQHIVRPSSYDKSKIIHHVRLSFVNKEITDALIKLGITNNKSLSMDNIINNIPIEYKKAFIIGYFDGDGSVSPVTTIKTKFCKKEDCIKQYPCYNLIITLRGTNNFLTGICTYLDISNSFIKQYDSIPRLTFANKKDVCNFFKCYENIPFFLERKYNIFLNRINHKSYDKYK